MSGNPDSTRKAIRRSILKQEGKRRVEATLSKEASDDLETVKRLVHGLKDDASAVRVALFIAANALVDAATASRLAPAGETDPNKWNMDELR